MLNKDYIDKFIKRKEYCQKCGTLLVKKISKIMTSYDENTGKPQEWAEATAKCPNKRFYNLHDNYIENGDMNFD